MSHYNSRYIGLSGCIHTAEVRDFTYNKSVRLKRYK